ncbi:hypothetical protein SAMN05421767_10572 [Granulicatella balaenopterae]|uniref:Phage protein n=1 Tax=Granulicatella balaenopterae TaxID=137733 RepID=A0A1H9IFN6_9LACT|nr:hypothetical protein [Granulicatella balaenopterae]SEQ73386.1 hypothetical protein SAMN05421767_10572 [Granulicatella balaenopterae]
MAKPLTETEYYYCIDYDRYVKCEDGMFYVIKNGKEEFNDFYARIIFGDIWTRDITEEEYYAQLN